MSIRIRRNALMSFLAASVCVGVSHASTGFSYSNQNADFSKGQPGWGNTLSLTNTSSSTISVKSISFQLTSPASLVLGSLYGSLINQGSPQLSATTQGVGLDQAITQYTYTLTYPKPILISPNTVMTLSGLPPAAVSGPINGIPNYTSPITSVSVDTSAGNVVASLAGACEGSACDDPAPGKLIGTYFTNWANYHSAPTDQLYPSGLPLRSLNTVFYDVASIHPADQSIDFTDPNHDQYYIPGFQVLRQQYPYLNAIISFGGWGSGSSMPSGDLTTVFEAAAGKNTAPVTTLAKNMVNTMVEYGFNGIDIDFEWTAPGAQLDTATARGYTNLLMDIRDDFKSLPNSNQYILTTAVFASPAQVNHFAQVGGDWQAVANAVTSVDLMAYDFHGQFDVGGGSSSITNFLSNQFVAQADPLGNTDFSVENAVEAYEKAGFKPDQVVIGIPAYTRIEAGSGETDQNLGLFVPLAANQPDGEYGGGVTDYKCIVSAGYCNHYTLPAGFKSCDSQNNYCGNPTVGSSVVTPWAYDTTAGLFMTYDDAYSAKYKGEYADTQGLRGVMVWEADGDVPMTDPDFTSESIIYNAWSGLTGKA